VTLGLGTTDKMADLQARTCVQRATKGGDVFLSRQRGKSDWGETHTKKFSIKKEEKRDLRGA